MKNIFRKITMLVLAVLCVLGLSACSAGSTIDTELTINADLSGKRVMEVAVNGEAFQESFHGDINTLNQVVERSCPKELTWQYQNRDGVDTYHVELSFSSPEDYKKKVESLLGEETTLELSAPTTVWANGFRIKEGFTSADLLDWMGSILVDGQLVDSSNRSEIFSDGTSKVIFGGKSYDSYAAISVNELEYLPLDRIDVLTAFPDAGQYDRSVIFYIPKASMAVKKNEIEAFLNGNVPDGAVSEWGEYEGGTTMKITQENMNLDTLNVYSKTVLASEKNEIITAEAETEPSVFSFDTGLRETLELSSYAGDESGRVQLGYYMSAGDSIDIKNFPDETLRLTEDDAYEGYGIALSKKTASETIGFVIEKSYPLLETNVTTTVKGTDKYERTSEFVLAETPQEAEQETILARVTALADGLAEVESSAEEGGYALTVVQKGTEEEIQESGEAVFGSGGVIYYAEDKGLMKLKHQTAFAENFNFDSFVVNMAPEYQLNYTVKTGFLNGIDKDDVDAPGLDDIDTGAGRVSCVSGEGNAAVSFAGSKWNLPGVVLWLVILAAAAVIIRGLAVTGALKELRELAAMAGKKKPMLTVKKPFADGGDAAQAQREAAAAAMPPENAGCSPESEPSREQGSPDGSGQKNGNPAAPMGGARFCPECGSPLEPGSAFCENCGHKLEE